MPGAAYLVACFGVLVKYGVVFESIPFVRILQDFLALATASLYARGG